MFETDFATNYNTTDNAWVTNATTFVGTGWNTGKTGYSLTATTGLGNQTANLTGNLSGSVGSVTGAVGSVTGAVGSVSGNVDGNVTGSVGSNLELGPAEVNAEVVDVIRTDTLTELSQAAPSATPTLEDAIMLLYMMARNKLVVQTSGTDALEVYNDAGTLICKKLLTDDGSDYTEAEMTTGP
ncbi:MAG: hypothetical protein ACYTFQ_31655 [Planctomycetota bacterium]